MGIIESFVEQVNKQDNEVYLFLKSLADDLYAQLDHKIGAFVSQEWDENSKNTIYRFSLIAPFRSNAEYNLFDVYMKDGNPQHFTLYIKFPIDNGAVDQRNDFNFEELKKRIGEEFTNNKAWVGLVQSLLATEYQLKPERQH